MEEIISVPPVRKIIFFHVLTFCFRYQDDPCFRDPCRGGVDCQQMEDRFECICSDVNLNRACLRGTFFLFAV